MKNGLVVMQAEDGDFVLNNASGNRNWDLTKDLKGYDGSGYLLWDTNQDQFAANAAGKPSTGPLEYTFRIDGDAKDVSGTYYITMRATKPATGEPHDRNNDFWVAAGDADDAPSGWKKVFFGGNAEKWLWASTYDVNHKKSPATFTVDGPGEYSIFVAGRSRQAAFDEIHVQKGKKNTDANAPSSEIVDGGAPAPRPSKPAPKQPVDKGDGGGGGTGGPAKAKTDLVMVDADDVTFRGNTGTVEIAASELLANDTGHDGRIVAAKTATDGSVATTDGGRTVVYTFDKRGFDGLDSFSYRITDNGSDAVARAYIAVDLDGAAAVGGAGKSAPTPAPKPKADATPTEAEGDFALVDARTDETLAVVGSRVVVEADGVEGMNLSVAARPSGNSVDSVRMFLDGRQTAMENDAPFALFGDDRGNITGGLSLKEGQDRQVAAAYYKGSDGGGGTAGRKTLAIEVENEVLTGRNGASDIFVLNEKGMNRDAISNFEERDSLALIGGTSAKQALAKASVQNGDTVIDFGGGNVLRLEDYTTLSADDFLV
jgi:hypothetical protein